MLIPPSDPMTSHIEGRRKPVIGLAGGIGSGKSTVARHMASLGAGVIDADSLAREALDQPEIRARLVALWGKQILDAGDKPDRAKLAALVFNDSEQRKRLESVIHPEVHRRRMALQKQFEADPSVLAIVEDVPLLMETGLDRSCDAVIFVACPVQTRLQRLAQTRGWAPDELHRREKCQLPLDFKAQQADYVIDNTVDSSHERCNNSKADCSADRSGGESACLSQVRGILARILRDFTA